MSVDLKDRVKSLERIRPSELLDHPKQWRTHPKTQQVALEGVLREIGIAGCLLAYQSPRAGNKLVKIDGHLRSATADVPWPTLVVDLTDEEADLLLSMYDPLSQMAGLDQEKLAELANSIKPQDEVVQNSLRRLCHSAGIVLDDEQVPEEEPGIEQDPEQLLKKWEVEIGQIWEGYGLRIMCGDSTDQANVLNLTQAKHPFLMVTDPPYGVNYNPEWRQEHDHAKDRRKGTVQNDDTPDWYSAYVVSACQVAYVWHAGVHAGLVASNLHEAGFVIRGQIIWRKQHFVFSRGNYHWQHEPCWYAVRKGSTAKWCGDRTQSTIWDIANANPHGGKQDDMDSMHSTQKPLECMARPIRNHGDKTDKVYDPFLGSGTTLVAAVSMGRGGYGMDIDPKYVALTLERLAQLGYPLTRCA